MLNPSFPTQLDYFGCYSHSFLDFPMIPPCQYLLEQGFHGFPAGAPGRVPEWSQSSRCCGPGSRSGRRGRDRRQRRHLAGSPGISRRVSQREILRNPWEHLGSWWFQPTPLKNDGASNSWDDDIPFPINVESHNPAMSQSPPTSLGSSNMVLLR